MAIVRCINHDRFGSCAGEVEVFVERDGFGTTLVIKTERDEVRISPMPDLHRMAAGILQAADRADRLRQVAAVAVEREVA